MHFARQHTRSSDNSHSSFVDFSADDASALVSDFCQEKEGSVLKAWLKHFDENNDQSISQHEFGRGLRHMGWNRDTKSLFLALDDNNSGGISLIELDEAQAQIWSHFRKWCVQKFDDVKDMLRSLGGKRAVEESSLPQDKFVSGLLRLDWEDREEAMLLFDALDKDSKGYVSAEQLSFLTAEKRREEKKALAKLSASRETKKRTQDTAAAKEARHNFKQFLKRKFGGYIRAWRSALCPHGAMTLQKTTFFKACMNIGWTHSLKFLWKAFDKDDNGHITIDELDLRSAEVLADFKENFVQKKFGNAKDTFRALDKDGTRRVQDKEFYQALKNHNFQCQAKLLFNGLDRYGNKALVEEDLHFLDEWKPLPFLVAAPDPRAADELRKKLARNQRTVLKAWRRYLDTTGSNHCNWQDFEAGCKKLGFADNLPGCWRHLDKDLQGYITLQHIDPDTSRSLWLFRAWAENEFGSVRSAFQVFDNDHSKEITQKEFVRCCHIYGFEGNAHELFKALDVNGDRGLTYKELGFLEQWEFPMASVLSAVAERGANRRESLRERSARDHERDEKSTITANTSVTMSRVPSSSVFSTAQSLRNERKQLPALNVAVTKHVANQDEEEAEPFPLFSVGMATPLYSSPPYKLAPAFKTRPATSSSPYSISSSISLLKPLYQPPDLPVQADFPVAPKCEDMLPPSCPDLHEASAPGEHERNDATRGEMSKQDPFAFASNTNDGWLTTRKARMKSGMPTLDELLVTVGTDCHQPSSLLPEKHRHSHIKTHSQRRYPRQRATFHARKLASLEKQKRSAGMRPPELPRDELDEHRQQSKEICQGS